MTRLRFVIVGFVSLVLTVSVLGGLRYAFDIVPTYNWSTVMFYVDPEQVDEVIEQIRDLEEVDSVRLYTPDYAGAPTVFGVVHYDGFMLMWMADERFEPFNTSARPWRRRFAPEPDEAEVRAALEQLQSLMPGHLGQPPIFVEDEAPQPACKRRVRP